MKKISRIICSAGFAALLTLLLMNAALLLAPGWNPFADLRDSDRLLWSSRIALVREDSPRLRAADLLVFGDSQAMSGVVPELLDARLNTRALNLGMPSQQPEGLLALAQLLPAAGPERPRRALVNVNPFMLFQSPIMESFQYYYRSELERYAPAYGGADSRRQPGEILHQYLLRLPLYEANYILAPQIAIGEAGLSSFTFAQLRARSDLLPAPEYEAYLAGVGPGPMEILQDRLAYSRWLRAFLIEHRGFWIWKKKTPSPRFDPGHCRAAVPRSDLDLSYRGESGPYVYPPRPKSIDAYRKAIETLIQKGYEVWLIEIPFSPAYGNLVNTERVYANVDRARREILAGLARPEAVRVISYPHGESTGPAPLAEARYFHDLTHLSVCGAGYYTRWLAGEMERRGF